MVSVSPSSLRARAVPYVLAVLGGAMQFLAFAGFDAWVLGFACYTPLLVALHLVRDDGWKRIARVAFLHGFVAYTGGYYWLVPFLDRWSGFPWVVCALIASIFYAYQALQVVAVAALVSRTRPHGVTNTAALVPSLVLVELVFPMIFPTYLGNGMHSVPRFAQIADIGGPVLVTAVMAAVCGALADLVVARLEKRAVPLRPLALAALCVSATLAYGTYRMNEVEQRIAHARHLHVAMVQVNMGTFEKDDEPIEGFRRHLEQSARVERNWHPDLLVWPESAFTFFVPAIPNLKNYVLGELSTPTLFGGLARRRDRGRLRDFNTAFLLAGNGDLLGTYDKVELIPFGEYLPFGETIPAIYDLSPNSGMFTPGRNVKPLVLDGVRMTTLICYEDLLPRFVRRSVMEANPHILVNLTNDAWYGNTAEPWTHLALAKYRAIEHHRALVRSTNSGVSAFVDPLGRIVSQSGVETREDLHAELPLLEGHTLFESLGEFPFLALAFFSLVLMHARRSTSFAEFYPFYLEQHSNRTCRRLHVIGTSLAIGTFATVVVTGRWALFPLVLVCGYGFAWVGHFFFEHNRPATFKNPLYSLLGDFVMLKDVLTGRIPF